MSEPETNTQEHLAQASAIANRMRQEIGKALIGQEAVVEQILIALFAAGHVLIEGVPVQFLPAYNALVEEAVAERPRKGGRNVRVS